MGREFRDIHGGRFRRARARNTFIASGPEAKSEIDAVWSIASSLHGRILKSEGASLAFKLQWRDFYQELSDWRSGAIDYLDGILPGSPLTLATYVDQAKVYRGRVSDWEVQFGKNLLEAKKAAEAAKKAGQNEAAARQQFEEEQQKAGNLAPKDRGAPPPPPKKGGGGLLLVGGLALAGVGAYALSRR